MQQIDNTSACSSCLRKCKQWKKKQDGQKPSVTRLNGESTLYAACALSWLGTRLFCNTYCCIIMKLTQPSTSIDTFFSELDLLWCRQ